MNQLRVSKEILRLRISRNLREFHAVTGGDAYRQKYAKLGFNYDELSAASKRQFQSSNLDDWLPKFKPKSQEELKKMEENFSNKHVDALSSMLKEKPYLANPLIVRAITEIEKDMEKTTSQIFIRFIFWVGLYVLLLLPPLVTMFTDPESSVSCNKIVEIPMLESTNPLDEILGATFGKSQSPEILEFFKRRESAEDLERITIRFSGTKPRTTQEELAATRQVLEKELFESIKESEDAVEVIRDLWKPAAETLFWSTFGFYFLSALTYSVPFTTSLKLAARRVLYIGKRASLCVWAYAIIELLHNISLLILYFQSYIMESKYRALMMIEKDDFNRQLIHSYGARGVALVRLLEEKEDSDQELIQLAKDIMFHHDNSDEEDNNILSGTISINDSIVVQLFDDPIRDDCFFADEEGFEKFKANVDKIKKMSREMLNEDYLSNPDSHKKMKIAGAQNNYITDVTGTLSWANIKRSLALSEMWERSNQESFLSSPNWQTFKDRFINYSLKSWYFLTNANDFAKRETGDCLCSNIRFFT